jgi:Lamin Tail Domain/Secretion system C-terminal sorting domain
MFKKYFTLAAFALLAASLTAQCNELFISEYVEGSRNNKAIEIYNPGKEAINLSNYRFTRWQNGGAVWSKQFSDSLYGTIGPNEVRVLVLDRRDTTQTGQDTPVTLVLRLKADLWLSKDYNTSFSMSFNGDDALSLDKKVNGQYVPVDIFGKIGQKPVLTSNPSRTIGWSDSFPYSTGLGLWYTIDKTLIRRTSVTKGVSANPTYFNPKTEWIPYPENTYDSLRTHNCICNTYSAGVDNAQQAELFMYPNPTAGNVMVIVPFEPAKTQVIDATGRVVEIATEYNIINRFRTVECMVSELPAGVYTLQVFSAQGAVVSGRLIKE